MEAQLAHMTELLKFMIVFFRMLVLNLCYSKLKTTKNVMLCHKSHLTGNFNVDKLQICQT